jgi:hypothetical protein
VCAMGTSGRTACTAAGTLLNLLKLCCTWLALVGCAAQTSPAQSDAHSACGSCNMKTCTQQHLITFLAAAGFKPGTDVKRLLREWFPQLQTW